jgi:hypothetical protein
MFSLTFTEENLIIRRWRFDFASAMVAWCRRGEVLQIFGDI